MTYNKEARHAYERLKNTRSDKDSYTDLKKAKIGTTEYEFHAQATVSRTPPSKTWTNGTEFVTQKIAMLESNAANTIWKDIERTLSNAEKDAWIGWILDNKEQWDKMKLPSTRITFETPEKDQSKKQKIDLTKDDIKTMIEEKIAAEDRKTQEELQA